MINAEPWSHQ